MATLTRNHVLADAILPSEGTALRIKQAILVVVGVIVLTLAAKAKIPLWPSPVPVTLGTFAVLTIGVAYGPMLGLTTILAYLAIGAAGFDVFASSNADYNGIAYMLGGSGGYLLGYALAIVYLGWAARRGLDRSVEGLGGALLVSNVLIYVPGVLWLQNWIVTSENFKPDQFAGVWDQTMAWGLTPFLLGDLIKLALAALLIPAVWRLVGKARA